MQTLLSRCCAVPNVDALGCSEEVVVPDVVVAVAPDVVVVVAAVADGCCDGSFLRDILKWKWNYFFGDSSFSV